MALQDGATELGLVDGEDDGGRLGRGDGRHAVVGEGCDSDCEGYARVQEPEDRKTFTQACQVSVC